MSLPHCSDFQQRARQPRVSGLPAQTWQDTWHEGCGVAQNDVHGARLPRYSCNTHQEVRILMQRQPRCRLRLSCAHRAAHVNRCSRRGRHRALYPARTCASTRWMPCWNYRCRYRYRSGFQRCVRSLLWEDNAHPQAAARGYALSTTHTPVMSRRTWSECNRTQHLTSESDTGRASSAALGACASQQTACSA